MDLFRLAFNDMPFKDVVAVSHDFLSKIALLDVEPFEGDRLHSIGMEIRMLPGPSAARLWCSPGEARRTAAHIADGNDNLVLVMPTDADMVISRRGREEVVCRAGEAYVWASDEPACFAYHEDCETLNLSLPRAALSSLGGGAGSALMRKIDPSRVRDLWLLRQYTDMLLSGGTMSPEAGRLAALHVADLAVLLLGPERDMTEAAQRPGVRAARLQAIKADIAANPARPLPPEAVALRHGISPRYLRALFAAEGTSFTGFVLFQRLACAHRMLLDPRLDRHTVAAIAYDAGFNDLSYFNRAFRRQYAMTPSDARACRQ